jgi:hypothetical protein
VADSSVALVGGGSADTRTAPGGDHRQVMVIGDEDVASVAHVVHPVSDFVTPALNIGSQGPALNVNPNAIQKATYVASFGNVASGALTANTAKAMFVIHHAASATRTVRIRRINCGGLQSTAIAGAMSLQLYRGTAAPTGGTALTPQPYLPGGAAAETTATQVPTSVTAATLLVSRVAAVVPATANTGFSDFSLVDFQESGEMIPFTLRAGTLDALVVSLNSSVAHNINFSISVAWTEE